MRFWVQLISSVWLLGGLAEPVQMQDVAPQTGTVNTSHGRGAAMVDLDNDGLLDLVNANSGMDNAFYRQLPDHTFEEANALWGVPTDTRPSWGVLVADFDNDGDDDVYFLNGGFNFPATNQLLRNDLDTLGAFTDVSTQSGDANLYQQTFGGTALDYDNDGLLDIFTSQTRAEGVTLLRNLGNLVFENVTVQAGLDTPFLVAGHYRHSSSGDIDNDGWIDVVVGSKHSRNLMLHNNGDGTFDEISIGAGVAWTVGKSFGSILQDFDNDGWMDLYVPLYQNIQVDYRSRLYVNDRDGTFTDVTAGSGMTGQTDMGHNAGDIDADGYPDIFIGTGHPDAMYPDVLFLIHPQIQNRLHATDISEISGILARGPTRSHGAPMGDYDQDGDIDLYLNNGGPDWLPGTLEDGLFWQNQGNAHNWVAVDLEGNLSNRTAVGARSVALTTAGRKVHRYLDVGRGFGNTNSHTQHFGIGDDAGVVRIDVRWPSGIEQSLVGPTLATTTLLRETGIVLEEGPVDMGGQMTFLASGPPNSQLSFDYALEVEPDPANADLPILAGVVRHLGDSALGAGGLGQLTLAVPPMETKRDTSLFYVQATITPPVGPALLSHPVRVDVLPP